MTKSPSPPSWAARCWVEGPTLHVDLPDAGGISHRLAFPCDLQGMTRLRQLLSNRNAHSTLGTKGDLTQHQLNKRLKEPVDITGKPIRKVVGKKVLDPEKQSAAKMFLVGLGLRRA